MKALAWTIEISVAPVWIADGFAMQQSYLDHIAETLIPYSEEGEVTVKVVKAPTEKQIEKTADGYEN